MPAPSKTAAAEAAVTAARPSMASRAADYLVMALSLVLGGGSLVLFALSGHPLRVALQLPPALALGWNALLSLLFFFQHSVLVRRPVRARISTVLPARYDGAFYSITSGISLAVFAVFVQPVGEPLFVLQGALRLVVTLASLLAVACFVWGIVVLRSFDAFGLRPIRAHLRRPVVPATVLTPHPKVFVARGPYRWVRHPLYAAILVLLWADPQMSLGRLEIAALWTAWICVGSMLEERDLEADFGDAYRQYRRRVPMLAPWRRPGD